MNQPPASTMLTHLHNDIQSRIKSLIVAELQKVCRTESLQVSGKKAELQERIKMKAQEYYDLRAENSLRSLDDRLRSPNSTVTAAARQSFLFKPSPFYKFERRLGQAVLPISKEHRNAVQLNFSLSQQDILALQQPNSTSRILIYAAVKSHKETGQLLDIQFPTQMEIRVNDNEVKANTRGMKSKPGTTKPVDITSFTRKRVDTLNKLTITYALTSTLFQVYVWLSDKQSIVQLKSEVLKRTIPKHRTLADLRAKADDTDIITTSTNMKLKDPVSFMRIQIPCRGSSCEHLGCFDLETYLSMQEQAPQWECPLCSKKVPFNDLAVDEYVQEILQKTSASDEQVTIDLDGKWSRETDLTQSKGSGNDAYQDDDDSDDLIEISGSRPLVSVKAEAPNTPLSMATPSLTGDAPSRGQKRSAAEVIDLTLDDDDDEPAHKRPNTCNDSRPSTLRQSSVHSQHSHAATNNYPYTTQSPLSFMLSGNSNIRNGTGSPSFRDNSPFNPPSNTFRNAVAPGFRAASSGTNSSQELNPARNQSSSTGSTRQSWSTGTFGWPGSGSGYTGTGV